eukprot:5689017-Pleurochrysis_carterae.AAC.7
MRVVWAKGVRALRAQERPQANQVWCHCGLTKKWSERNMGGSMGGALVRQDEWGQLGGASMVGI